MLQAVEPQCESDTPRRQIAMLLYMTRDSSIGQNCINIRWTPDCGIELARSIHRKEFKRPTELTDMQSVGSTVRDNTATNHLVGEWQSCLRPELFTGVRLDQSPRNVELIHISMMGYACRRRLTIFNGGCY